MPKGIYPRPSPEERFWAKVNKQGPIPVYRPELGPCWIWTRGKTGQGYGNFRVDGRRVDGRSSVPAHRFAYELLVGPIPERLEPDHLCRVHPCVKAIADEFGPAHLELVTKHENILRGFSPWALNARKTHCPKGHPYDGANTRIESSGRRRCRSCERDRARRYRATNGEAINARARTAHRLRKQGA